MKNQQNNFYRQQLNAKCYTLYAIRYLVVSEVEPTA
jgi:hypothetical protein